MLLPKFTLRWILGAMFVVALLFVIVREALTGELWAISIVSVVLLGGIAFGLYAATFLASYVVLLISQTYFPQKQSQNPFVVEGQFPPQQVPQDPTGEQV